MKLKNLLALFFFLYSTYSWAGSAMQCVYIDGNSLKNRCSVTIDVIWCSDSNQGDTCRNGFNKESDIQPGGSEAIIALPSPGLSARTEYLACSGSNSVVHISDKQKKATCN